MNSISKVLSHNDYIEVINACLQQNNLELASRVSIEALFLFPESFRLNYFLALIAKKNGQKENALHYISKAGEIYNTNKITKQDIPYVNDVGGVLIELGEYKLAEEFFAAYLKLEPQNFVGLYNMSQVFLIKNDYEKVLEWLQKAERINPTYDVVHNICVALCNLKKIDLAEEYCIRASKLNPKDWRPYYNLGTIKQNLGLNNEAIAYFKKSIKFSPDSGQAYQCLGEISSFTRDPKNCNDSIKEINLILKKPDLKKNSHY